MIEASGDNVPVEEFRKAVKLGAKECNLISRAISQLRRSYGKVKRAFGSDTAESTSDGSAGASNLYDQVRRWACLIVTFVTLCLVHVAVG